MCGRFTQRSSWPEIQERMDLAGPALDLRPRYNAAPGQKIAAVRAGDRGRSLAMLLWGLIPAWAKDPAIGRRLINARSETAAQKPSFRAAWRLRRCLVPADGFYEWQGRGGVRRPWLFGLRGGEPFALAGLWEGWTVPEGALPGGSLAGLRPGSRIETCAILTTAANRMVAPVHSRMPAIVPPEDYGRWLSGEAMQLEPYPADGMAAHRVGTRVNNPASDDPGCIEPASPI